MNKKFILALSSSILLLTACKGEATPDSKTIANEAYNLFVASAKDSNAFKVKDTITSDKFNATYTHNRDKKVKKDTDIKTINYALDFSNVNLTSSFTLGGLKEHEKVDEACYNAKLVSELNVESAGLTGSAKNTNTLKDNTTKISTLTFNNLAASNVKGYINCDIAGEPAGTNYYGAYVDFNDVATKMKSGIKVEGERKTEIESTINEFATKFGTGNNKRYTTIKKMPVLPYIIQGTVEAVLGSVGQAVTEFGDGKMAETDKNELINSLAQGIDALNTQKAFTYSKKNNIITYTFALTAAQINALAQQEVIKGGTFAATIQSDSSNRLAKVDLKVTGLKTDALPIVTETDESGKVDVIKSFSFDDVNLNLTSEFDYSTSYDTIKKGVDTITNKGEGWKSFNE